MNTNQEIHNNEFIIHLPHILHKGWDKAFKSIAEYGDDIPLDFVA